MPGDATSRAAHRRAHASRWPIRSAALGDQVDIDPLDGRTADELVTSVWALTLEAWSLTGRALPQYERSAMPGKVLRRTPP